MARVLCVYRKVKLLQEAAARSRRRRATKIAINLIRRIRPGDPGPSQPHPPICRRETGFIRPSHATLRRQTQAHTVRLLAASTCDRQGSRAGQGSPTPAASSVEFLKLSTRIIRRTTQAIHSLRQISHAHISRRRNSRLARTTRGPLNMFNFTHQDRLVANLVEGITSAKLDRAVLRIRVSSKQELRERIMAAWTSSIAMVRSKTWTYKLDNAA